ncbi:histidine phosphatase family protein [Silvanigrella sp.]|jgi:broad specificity phosphatase PhoE|uniref:histidine phosphatase family protein n=1 Tax=Silvanigrella sp. TaxID=2024976 RepID=UPI0037C547FA
MQIEESRLPILILFRHGQTDYNAQKRFQGQINCSLNLNGIEQAHKTAEYITQLLKSILTKNSDSKIVECLTSDLQRSKETSQVVENIIKKELNIELNFKETESFREYHCGDLTNHTIDEYSEKYPKVIEDYFKEYKEDPWYTKFPGKEAESWHMVSKRISIHLKKLNDNFILFENAQNQFSIKSFDNTSNNIYIWSTHGGIIRNLLLLMSVDQDNGIQTYGNGDVLLLRPVINYKNENKLNQNRQEVFPGTLFPVEQAKFYDFYVAWEILNHFKVGDSITALTDLQSHLK